MPEHKVVKGVPETKPADHKISQNSLNHLSDFAPPTGGTPSQTNSDGGGSAGTGSAESGGSGSGDK